MKLLSIDASGKTAACAITQDDLVLAKSFTESTLTHSQTLLPMIDNTLVAAELDIGDIDAFALTVGPGSFTGLRIGAATIMGLANNKPCYPVSTLLAIAYNFKDTKTVVIPALDARRNQVYTAEFKTENGIVTRTSDDCAMSVQEVVDIIKTKYADQNIVIAGDGAYLFADIEFANNVTLAKGEMLYAQGDGIALAAKTCKSVKAMDIKLSYLRLSQAERELKEKMSK